MTEDQGLKVVDAFDLEPELRALLRPGQAVRDDHGRLHVLPRYFYEVPSHEAAVSVRLTRHFGLNELLLVDLKEAQRLRAWPRYVPCAVRVLAFYLERLREAAGTSLYLAVNGGYRSPAHKLSVGASPHMWGTAADLYRVGSTVLCTQESIEKYNALVEDVSEDLYAMPYGHEVGRADDHVHIDLGYMAVVPREMNEDMREHSGSPRFAIEERRRRRDRRQPVVVPGSTTDRRVSEPEAVPATPTDDTPNPT